jgi:hypothetical protein
VRRKKPAGQIDHDFWQKELQTMAQKICTILQLAGQPVTRESFLAFAASLPLSQSDLFCDQWKRKFCYHCMNRLYERTKGTEREEEGRELTWHFARDFVNSCDPYKRHLMTVLRGVLRGLYLDRTPALYQRFVLIHAHPANN